jgi:hypothetical protein
LTCLQRRAGHIPTVAEIYFLDLINIHVTVADEHTYRINIHDKVVAVQTHVKMNIHGTSQLNTDAERTFATQLLVQISIHDKAVQLDKDTGQLNQPSSENSFNPSNFRHEKSALNQS